MSGHTYGRNERTTLPYLISSHQTPLFRHLQGEQKALQQNKVVNLDLAIQHLHSFTLKPGERLSYWRAIGNPTANKGYLPGMTLTQGKITEGVGGGLCQLSNLIFWLTIHTPLTVIERWRHSYDVFPDNNRTQPFGSGATCSYPNIDLEILNETDEIYQLHLSLTDTHLVGEWKSTKPLTSSFTITERNPSITHEPWCGYMRHNTIIREERDLESNQLINETVVAENHAIMMYEPLLQEKGV
jgi:vancomycin resistance protein VanW